MPSQPTMSPLLLGLLVGVLHLTSPHPAGAATGGITCETRLSLDGTIGVPMIEVARGQTVIFRVKVQNESSEEITDVSLTTELPPGLTDIAILDGPCAVQAGEVDCTFEILLPFECAEVRFTAQVDQTGPSDIEVTTQASALCSPIQLDAFCAAVIRVGLAEVRCRTEVSLDNVNFSPQLTVPPDALVYFKTTLTNTGELPLRGTGFADDLDATLNFHSVQPLTGSCGVIGETIVCSAGTLEPAEAVTIRYSAITVARVATSGFNSAGVATGTGTAENPGASVSDSCRARIDILDDEICLAGTVNGAVGTATDILFVNGSSGGADRTVHLATGEPFTLSLLSPPAGPATANYVLWAWFGGSVNRTLLEVGEGSIGCLANPTPLQNGSFPQPFRCLASPPLIAALCHGVPTSPAAEKTPWSFTLNAGIGNPTTITLQALVRDNNSAADQPYSVSNILTVEVGL